MQRRAVRLVYLAVGLVCTALGVVGIILPVMPGTVFLLTAAWAFSKSSARLETWLLEHPRLGRRIREWREHHVIPWSVKITAWTSMAASLAIMVLTEAPPIAFAGGGTLIAIGAVYIAAQPSKIRAAPPTSS